MEVSNSWTVEKNNTVLFKIILGKCFFFLSSFAFIKHHHFDISLGWVAHHHPIQLWHLTEDNPDLFPDTTEVRVECGNSTRGHDQPGKDTKFFNDL